MSPQIHVAFAQARAADLHIAAANARLLSGRAQRRRATRDSWLAGARRRPQAGPADAPPS